MSRLGGATAFAAEASLWIAGAALIAGAAGMHWNVDLQRALNELTGSTPSAAASAGASPSPTASPTATGAVQSLAPGASPTISPIVAKYQAYVARADYQLKTKYTAVMTATVAGSPYEIDVSGTMSYKAGDGADGERDTLNGTVTTYDYVYMGSVQYTSTNGGAWTKSTRSATSAAAAKLMFAPAMLFVDGGIETKNGAQLHRLEVADPAAYSTAFLKTQSGATDAQATCTVWVTDDGAPAAMKIEGWVKGPIQGVPTRINMVEELRTIATSGVTITAPV